MYVMEYTGRVVCKVVDQSRLVSAGGDSETAVLPKGFPRKEDGHRVIVCEAAAGIPAMGRSAVNAAQCVFQGAQTWYFEHE